MSTTKRKGSLFESLKNYWAMARISPQQFYNDFYRRYSTNDYKSFLQDINVYELWTPALSAAARLFRRKYFQG